MRHDVCVTVSRAEAGYPGRNRRTGRDAPSSDGQIGSRTGTPPQKPGQGAWQATRRKPAGGLGRESDAGGWRTSALPQSPCSRQRMRRSASPARCRRVAHAARPL